MSQNQLELNFPSTPVLFHLLLVFLSCFFSFVLLLRQSIMDSEIEKKNVFLFPKQAKLKVQFLVHSTFFLK